MANESRIGAQIVRDSGEMKVLETVTSALDSIQLQTDLNGSERVCGDSSQ